MTSQTPLVFNDHQKFESFMCLECICKGFKFTLCIASCYDYWIRFNSCFLSPVCKTFQFTLCFAFNVMTIGIRSTPVSGEPVNNCLIMQNT